MPPPALAHQSAPARSPPASGLASPCSHMVQAPLFPPAEGSGDQLWSSQGAHRSADKSRDAGAAQGHQLPGGLQPPTHTSSHPAKCTQATSSGMFKGRAGPRCSVHQWCLALEYGDTTLHSWDQHMSQLTPWRSWTLMAQILHGSAGGSPMGGGCHCPLPSVPLSRPLAPAGHQCHICLWASLEGTVTCPQGM